MTKSEITGFQNYYNLADELHANAERSADLRMTLDDFVPQMVRSAERVAEVFGLEWPPALVDAEEFLLEHRAEVS